MRGAWGQMVLGVALSLPPGAAGGGQAPVVRRPAARASASSQQPADPQAPGGLGSDGIDAPEAPASGTTTIRVRSRLVNVLVNAIDAEGRPVSGYDKRDFEVLEDGRPQTIAVFEKQTETPLSMVVAVDTSETVLRDERAEKQAARQFLRTVLRPQDEVALLQFSDTVEELVPFSSNLQRLQGGLGELRRGSETALFDAVLLGSRRLGELKADAGRRRVMVLITDGGDTKDHSTYRQAVDAALRAGVMIYPLVIVPVQADAGRNTGGEHALIQMAEDTGGRWFYVTDTKDLSGAFAKVSDDLRTQYVLGYYAPKGDAGFRRIKVRLREGAAGGGSGGGAVSLHYRSGYYADGR